MNIGRKTRIAPNHFIVRGARLECGRHRKGKGMSALDDPRVFFAAERTLLAWNRTSLTLMGFGFLIERFGLFLRLIVAQQAQSPALELERGAAYWVGIIFIALGSVIAVVSTVQYRQVLRTLKPSEIPERYAVNMGVIINLVVAVLGIGLIAYLFQVPGE